MSDDFVENLKQIPQWQRILFMLGFTVVLYIVSMVLLVLTLAQALFALLTTRDNENLRSLGAALAFYVYEIIRFLTYNSEHKPFPFAPFPFQDDPATAVEPTAVVTPVVTPAASPAPTVKRTTPRSSTVRKRTTTRKSAAPKSVKSVKSAKTRTATKTTTPPSTEPKPEQKTEPKSEPKSEPKPDTEEN